MLEPEMQFCDVNQLMDVMQDMMKFIVNRYIEDCKTEIDFLCEFVDKDLMTRLDYVKNQDFKKIEYTEAIKMLEQALKDGVEFENKKIF